MAFFDRWIRSGLARFFDWHLFLLRFFFTVALAIFPVEAGRGLIVDRDRPTLGTLDQVRIDHGYQSRPTIDRTSALKRLALLLLRGRLKSCFDSRYPLQFRRVQRQRTVAPMIGRSGPPTGLGIKVTETCPQ